MYRAKQFLAFVSLQTSRKTLIAVFRNCEWQGSKLYIGKNLKGSFTVGKLHGVFLLVIIVDHAQIEKEVILQLNFLVKAHCPINRLVL